MSASTLPISDASPVTPGRTSFFKDVSWGGWVLFIICLSLFLSAFKGLRPAIGGLRIHPFLILVGAVAPLALFAPAKLPVRRSLDGFGVLLFGGLLLSFFGNEELSSSSRFMIKWATSGLIFMVVVRLVRTHSDIRLAVAGLIFAVALIGIRGLMIYRANPSYYVDVMPGIGSRNVYSLWTLAPFAFAAWMITERDLPRRTKLLLGLAMFFTATPQILSLSRSGWALIAVTLGLVFALRRSARVAIGVAVFAVFLQLALQEFNFIDKVIYRFGDLERGTTADWHRETLAIEGLRLFFENPFLGVSQTQLPYELGHRLVTTPIESHNLFIDLLAGTGLAGTVPLLLCGLVIFMRARGASRHGIGPSVEFARTIPVILALIALRGMTANEVLYNPSVIIGLGLAFAAANIAIAEARLRAARQTALIRSESKAEIKR